MAVQVRAADFAAFLKKRLAAKDGYIMGAIGQNPKSLSDWYFTGQYSGSQLDKALYWKANAERVWDCNGLAEGYYKDTAGVNINTRARNNYSEWCDPKGSGSIPAAYRVPGAAVFKKSSYIHHVGFLIEPVNPDKPSGDWYVIEAKGVMYGVVKTKLNGGGWNYWGLMTKYFDYGDAAAALTQPFALGGRLLKKGASGSDVKLLQEALLKLGYALPVYGADGDFGSETEAALRALQAALGISADGMYGDETHAALMAELEHGEETVASEPAAVTQLVCTAARSAYVRTGPGTDYSILTVVRADDVLDSTAAAENGWRCVAVNGGFGWISPKMCRVK